MENFFFKAVESELALALIKSLFVFRLSNSKNFDFFELDNLNTKSDFIKANRGPHGGYILNKNSSDISVVEIIEALDGPITLTSCVDNSESFCESSDTCFLGGKWNKINEIIRKSLNDISLKDLLSYEKPFLTNENEKISINRIN